MNKSSGISIKGNDILKRGCKSGSHYNKPPPPPSSPRIQLIDEALLREQQSRESRRESRGPSEQSWRPASVVRRLGQHLVNVICVVFLLLVVNMILSINVLN